ADRVTVHRRDDRLGEIGHQRDRALPAPARHLLDKSGDRLVSVRLRILQIRPGTERVTHRIAGQHDATDVAVLFKRGHQFDEPAVVFIAPGVARFWPAEGQHRDLAAFFIEQWHGNVPLSRPSRPRYTFGSGKPSAGGNAMTEERRYVEYEREGSIVT